MLGRYALSLAVCAIVLFASEVPAGGTGACCLPCDPCTIITEQECLDQEGYYLGDDTICDDCPMPTYVPDPQQCTVEPADAMIGLFVCPGAPLPIEASRIKVTVRGACGEPFSQAHVLVSLTSANPVCGGGSTIAGTTNSAGEVVLTLSASGCTDEQPLSGLIKANGLTIRAYENVKSPDSDTSGNVALPDLIAFSNEFLGQSDSQCHDYDNREGTGLSDLILFARAFQQANHCP